MQEWKLEFGSLEQAKNGSVKDKTLTVLALGMQRQKDFWDSLANQLRLNCSLVGDAISQDRVKRSQEVSLVASLYLPYTLTSMCTYIHIEKQRKQYLIRKMHVSSNV